MIPQCKAWRVTYKRRLSPGVFSAASCTVHAVNRRFALWNAQKEIGYPLPADKVSAGIINQTSAKP